MNMLWKLLSPKKLHHLIEKLEQDLGSEDQKTHVERTPEGRSRCMRLRYNVSGRDFEISMDCYWTRLYTESNEMAGRGLMSHQVSAFKTPNGMFQRLLFKTKDAREMERKKNESEARRREHQKKMIDLAYRGLK